MPTQDTLGQRIAEAKHLLQEQDAALQEVHALSNQVFASLSLEEQEETQKIVSYNLSRDDIDTLDPETFQLKEPPAPTPVVRKHSRRQRLSI